MPKKPLCVAFLWHMHQPDYHDPRSRELLLPWTRFHAVKDYYDMGALIEREPRLHATINVVPSLAEQLVSYGAGTARESYADITLRDASELNEHEKSFLLRKFFQLSPKQMVAPYRRYKELLDRRGSPDPQGIYSAALRLYGAQDFRDLQMWYNLAWCGQELRRHPEIASFLAQGRGFTESDKKRLLEIQYSFTGSILPFYRKLCQSGKVELSVSPYFHPILPLLCDSRSARDPLPSLPLPSNPFAFPEDARQHISQALRIHAEYFGSAARGMWPSEGAVSDAALALAQEQGVEWLASDEIVLWNSLFKGGDTGAFLPPDRKYCAYRWGQDGPCLFFRDHALSDLFGFSYYQWNAADAAADFLRRLDAIHQSLPDDGRHYVVAIILDGENAWEHYPNNASDFLSLLYRRLSESESLRTVTFSEFLELEPHREILKSVMPGSWIYGNLATWIGHPEKNRAWEELTAARSLWSSFQIRGDAAAAADAAFREIMIAEGSDWYWWYGDDHQTENAAEFDALFRSHLKNVYTLLGETPPVRLDEAIKKVGARPSHQNPMHTITPKLDGKVTDYFEWLPAGFTVSGGGDSMHRTDRYLDKVFFGFDLQCFYIRIDPVSEKMTEFSTAISLEVQFASPEECRLALEYTGRNSWSCRTIQWPLPDRQPRFAGNKILELGIPLEVLGVSEPIEVAFFMRLLDNGREVERFPAYGFLSVRTDPWSLDEQEWIV